MHGVVTVVVLLGLTCSAWSNPLNQNYGGRVQEVRDALEHINKVRSALRRSLDLREEDSKANSVVRGLQLPVGSLLGHAVDTVKKSADLAKRHIELNRRDADERALRGTAEKMRRAVDGMRSDLDATKREEDNMAFHMAKKAIDGLVQKRSGGSLLSGALDTITKAAEMAKRHVDMKRRSYEAENNRALREVAGKFKRQSEHLAGHILIKKGIDMARRYLEEEELAELRKRQCGHGLGFCDPVALGGAKRSLNDKMKYKRQGDLHLAGGVLGSTVNAIKKSVELARRHLEQEELKKRSDDEFAGELRKRQCGHGLGFCDPVAMGGAKRSLNDVEESRSRALRGVAEKFETAMNEMKHKRQSEGLHLAGGVLGSTVNAIKKSVELARRHLDQEEEKGDLRKRQCGHGLGFCGPEVQAEKREEEEEEEERSVFAETFKRATDALSQMREAERRRREEQEGSRVFRDLADQIKTTAEKLGQKRDVVEEEKREENVKQLRSVADNLKKAIENIKKKRELEETKREEEMGNMFRRNPAMAFSGSIKELAKRNDEWKRNVQEVLDNKAAQIRAIAKKFPASRAVPEF